MRFTDLTTIALLCGAFQPLLTTALPINSPNAQAVTAPPANSANEPHHPSIPRSAEKLVIGPAVVVGAHSPSKKLTAVQKAEINKLREVLKLPSRQVSPQTSAPNSPVEAATSPQTPKHDAKNPPQAVTKQTAVGADSKPNPIHVPTPDSEEKIAIGPAVVVHATPNSPSTKETPPQKADPKKLHLSIPPSHQVSPQTSAQNSPVEAPTSPQTPKHDAKTPPGSPPRSSTGNSPVKAAVIPKTPMGELQGRAVPAPMIKISSPQKLTVPSQMEKTSATLQRVNSLPGLQPTENSDKEKIVLTPPEGDEMKPTLNPKPAQKEAPAKIQARRNKNKNNNNNNNQNNNNNNQQKNQRPVIIQVHNHPAPAAPAPAPEPVPAPAPVPETAMVPAAAPAGGISTVDAAMHLWNKGKEIKNAIKGAKAA